MHCKAVITPSPGCVGLVRDFEQLERAFRTIDKTDFGEFKNNSHGSILIIQLTKHCLQQPFHLLTRNAEIK